MTWTRIFLTAISLTIGAGSLPHASAADLKIRLPKRSVSTPVQQLNREGVDAIRKQQYEKAKNLFYKAYLYDPGDPFTLNNLGYISELEGQVERAHNFYALAAGQATDAAIDRASLAKLEGQSFRDVVGSVRDIPMQVNRANVEAVRLLSQGRGAEADSLLRRTLALDPHNGFTLNNMGVAKETEGEFEQALTYYQAAASNGSKDLVVVTLNRAWAGKPVSAMAAESAKKIQERMRAMDTPQAKAALLNLRAVSAINRNEWQSAGADFLQAYKLDPNNAFTLNNVGFLSEMEGDLETAQVFYEEAEKAKQSETRVGIATRAEAEGMKVAAVADDSDNRVDATIEEDREAKSKQTGPIRLKRRDQTPVVEPDAPPPQQN